VTKSPVYHILQDSNITPSIHTFTFYDSSWDDDHDNSRSTGGFLVFYQGGIEDHSSNTPGPVATRSAETDYKKICMACMSTSPVHMTLNRIEDVEDESKEDKSFDIFMDNKSVIDMIITFKYTTNARHTRHIFHFVKQRIQYEWHTLIQISNQSIFADGMIKVLAKNDPLHKIQYMLTVIDRY
jgi:hypothetical protein